MTQCKVCKLDPAVDEKCLCADCQSLKALFKKMSPERKETMRKAAFEMADDLLDKKFGPEPGTVIH